MLAEHGRDENWAHQITLALGQSSVGALNVRLTVHIDRITQALIGCAGESPFDRDGATFLVAEFAKPLPQCVQRSKKASTKVELVINMKTAKTFSGSCQATFF